MNKNKAMKIMNELEENIRKSETERTRLYVESWVIGSIHMLKDKMNGGCSYYPYNATYKDLYRDLVHYFLCESIVEEIKEETMNTMVTEENSKLITDLGYIIYHA